MAISDDVKALIDKKREEAKAEVTQISVDLDAFTAANVNEFLAANRANDMNRITKALIPFMLGIPKEWGDAKDVKAYEKLPLVLWREVVQRVAELVNYMTSKN